MKKCMLCLALSLLLIPIAAYASDIPIDETNFPDPVFRAWCLEQPWGYDGVLTGSEISTIDSIYIRGEYDAPVNIQNMDGIEYFTAITHFVCTYGKLSTLDLSNNTALEHLECDNNQLTTLNIQSNTALTLVICSDNLITTLNVRNNTALRSLYCYNNQLTAMDISNNMALTSLGLSGNKLTTLDISNNIALKLLFLGDNQLTTLDVSNNPALRELYCELNPLTTLDVSNNPELRRLSCLESQLTELDLSHNTKLYDLDCGDNSLTALNIKNNPALLWMYCDDNQLTALDLSNNTQLMRMSCGNNQIATLDLSRQTKLEELYCDHNRLSSLDISENDELVILHCDYNYITDTTALEDWLENTGHEGHVLPQYGLLSVSGTTVADKVYDSTVIAAVTVGTVSGIVDGDDVTVTATGVFDTNEIGENKTVTVIFALSGTDAHLYTAPPSEQFTASILSPIIPYTITVTPNNAVFGSTAGDGIYNENTPVTVTAAANEGYHFVEWTENDASVSTNASYTFNAIANRTLVAVFASDVNPPETENVVTGISAGVAVAVDDIITFTVTGGGMNNAAPKIGDYRWLPTLWQVNPSGTFETGFTQSFSTTGMTLGEHTLTITFVKQLFDGTTWVNTMPAVQDTESVSFALQAADTAITVTAQPTDQTVTEGQTASFSISATGDHVFAQWYINRNDTLGWQMIEGANAFTYTTTVTEMCNNGYRYFCRLTDAYDHTLDSAIVSLYVSPNTIPPVTGDSQTPLLYLVLCTLACLALCMFVRKSKQKV